MTVFTSTLNQIAFLFTLIAIGYLLAKLKVLPEGSEKVLAKLENTVFIPALVLGTFIENFTVERISSAWLLLLVSAAILVITVPVSIFICRALTKDKYVRNIYVYGLAFSNFGFMGNAVVSALYPEIFFEYLIFTLPLWTLIYLWGVPVLLLGDSEKKPTVKGRLKSFVNPMFVAMIVGMIIGLTGLKLPTFAVSVIDTAGSCMSPIAMLLTGITVSKISLKSTFTNWRIYTVSALRLAVYPLIFIALSLIIPFGDTVFTCALASLAMPLGLNTIVIPSALGKDTTEASGMAIISHMLSVITIPLIFMLAELL